MMAAKRMIGIGLCSILVGGIAGGLLGYSLSPGKSGDPGGSMVIGAGDGNGIALTSEKILAEEYADYGISPLAETAYVITVTVQPDTTTYPDVEMSLAWTATDDWSTGKTVTDYVTVAEGSDNSTWTVSCLQAFGTQITLTATNIYTPGVSATCAIDYVSKIQGVTLSMGSIDCTINGSTNVNVAFDGYGSGGMPDLDIMQNSVYSLLDSYTVTYDLEPLLENSVLGASNIPNFLFIDGSGEYDTFFAFGTLDYSNGNYTWGSTGLFQNYDPAQGLFFGTDWMHTNLGMNYYDFNSSMSMTDWSNVTNDMQIALYNGSTDKRIFRLTIDVYGQYSGETTSYYTDFVMDGYTTTTIEATGVTIAPTALRF